jgi:transcriptional regulator with XRE-family HTH domain
MKPTRRLDGGTLDYLLKRYHLDTPRFWVGMALDHANTEVSMMVYALRTAAGLTQAGLAKRVGTTASVISRLEDSEYKGHSLAMLRRIAEALGMQVVVRFAPQQSNPRPGWILDKTQQRAVRNHLAGGEQGAVLPRVRRPPRRSRPARRSAKRAG